MFLIWLPVVAAQMVDVLADVAKKEDANGAVNALWIKFVNVGVNHVQGPATQPPLSQPYPPSPQPTHCQHPSAPVRDTQVSDGQSFINTIASEVSVAMYLLAGAVQGAGGAQTCI